VNYVASRLSVIKPSASMAASQAAKALGAQGVDVIDLGLGEPDFPTPAHIIDAAFAAARGGQTLYTASAGTQELRDAVAGKFRRENGLDYAAADIVVANGAKQIIFNALLATLEDGDEAILPAPYFVSYPEMVKLLGGRPVVVACPETSGFKLTPELLDRAVTPQTKWVFLNTPGNPSGAVYSEAELKALGAVLARHPHVLVLSDEIYEHILFDGRNFVSFGKACPELRDRSLIVNGVSKAYAMTGWRVGYAAGPAPLVKAMATIQSQSVTSVSSIAQAAAVAALNGPQDEVGRFCEAFEARRDLVVSGIRKVNGLTLSPPEGAFYAYLGCGGLIGRKTPKGAVLEDDFAVAQYLLHEGRVAGVPGVAYGLSPFVRISTATSEAVLTEAVARITAAVANLDSTSRPAVNRRAS
jgi:aspartate aminotransferase